MDVVSALLNCHSLTTSEHEAKILKQDKTESADILSVVYKCIYITQSIETPYL